MRPYLVRFNSPTGAHEDVDVEQIATDGHQAIQQARRENPDLRGWRVTAADLSPAQATSCRIDA